MSPPTPFSIATPAEPQRVPPDSWSPQISTSSPQTRAPSPVDPNHGRLKRGRSRLFDVVGLLVLLAMGFSIFTLVKRFGTGFGELDIELTQEELEAGFREGFAYYSLYLGADKVGTLRVENRHSGEGYQITTEMELNMPSGILAGSRSHSTLDAYLNSEFRLQSFEAAIDGLLTAEIEGQWNEETSAMVVTGLPGESGAQEFSLPEAPFILPSLRPVLMRKNLAEGDRISFTYYDPLSQAPITTDVTYLGQEDLELMGKIVEAYHFQEHAMGHVTNVWVNALGEVLIEEMPMGFRAVREPEAEAKFGLRDAEATSADAEDGVVFDPIGDTSLDRWRWEAATLELKGLKVSKGISDVRQSAQVEGGTVVVTIKAPNVQPTFSRLSEQQSDEKAEFLRSAFGIDLDAPAIRSAHRDVGIAPETSVSVVADMLTQWVADEIELITVSPDVVETASDVLERRRGGTMGKALALAALLRMSGIPSRVAHGAVVTKGRLVQHQWVEAWLGAWVAIDPTFKQLPADAGHLRLSYGGRMDQALARTALERVRVIRLEGE